MATINRRSVRVRRLRLIPLPPNKYKYNYTTMKLWVDRSARINAARMFDYIREVNGLIDGEVENGMGY